MVAFFTRVDAGVLAQLRNVVRKKNGGRGASSRGFVRKIVVSDFFFVGDATQVIIVPENRKQNMFSLIVLKPASSAVGSDGSFMYAVYTKKRAFRT